MGFIYEDISSITEPTDTELTSFMNRHREKYLIDPQVSFRQVYISTYKRGASAVSDAQRVLTELNSGIDPDTVGGSTLLSAEIPLSPLWDIRNQFGDDFARTLLAMLLVYAEYFFA